MFLRVEGNAMHPTIKDNDLLQVDPADEPMGNGEDVAVMNIGGNVHVCKYTNFGSQLILIHDNAPITVVRREQVEFMGKAIVIENEKSHLIDGKVAL